MSEQSRRPTHLALPYLSYSGPHNPILIIGVPVAKSEAPPKARAPKQGRPGLNTSQRRQDSRK